MFTKHTFFQFLCCFNTISIQKVLKQQCFHFVPTSGIWQHFQNFLVRWLSECLVDCIVFGLDPSIEECVAQSQENYDSNMFDRQFNSNWPSSSTVFPTTSMMFWMCRLIVLRRSFRSFRVITALGSAMMISGLLSSMMINNQYRCLNERVKKVINGKC